MAGLSRTYLCGLCCLQLCGRAGCSFCTAADCKAPDPQHLPIPRRMTHPNYRLDHAALAAWFLTAITAITAPYGPYRPAVTPVASGRSTQ